MHARIAVATSLERSTSDAVEAAKHRVSGLVGQVEMVKTEQHSRTPPTTFNINHKEGRLTSSTS